MQENRMNPFIYLEEFFDKHQANILDLFWNFQALLGYHAKTTFSVKSCPIMVQSKRLLADVSNISKYKSLPIKESKSNGNKYECQ